MNRKSLLTVVKRGFTSLIALLALTFPVIAAGVTTEYQTEQDLQPGMIVSRDADNNNVVESANPDNAAHIFGVVVNFEESLIAIGGQSGGSVQVAHDGTLNVLVSDLGGSIAEGDVLAISPLSGVAQKADQQTVVIGTALASFDGGSDETVGTASLQNSAGESVEVKLGRIQVQFEVGANPNINSASGAIPGFLQATADLIAGRPVSPARVIAAVIVLFLTLVISGTLLFSAIRNALVAIGRNPLSRGAVYRGMLQVFLIVVIILVIGLGVIYVILRT